MHSRIFSYFNLQPQLSRHFLLGISLLLSTGCQGIRYELPGHSLEAKSATVTLPAGTNLTALKTPGRMPVPGGFWLGLSSETPEVLAVETTIGFSSSSRATLHALKPGTAIVHYVNRFTCNGDAHSEEDRQRLRQRSLGAFTVVVMPTD